MIKSGSSPRLPAVGAKIRSLLRLKWLFSVVVAVLFTVAATTPSPDQQNPDEQYINIMNIIDRADALRKAGQLDAAKVKYHEAQTNLLTFKAYNPLFAPKTVTYRLNELSERLETRPPVPSAVVPATKPKAKLEAEPTASTSKSVVKLIDAGAEPRQVLRLHVKPGDKQTAIMTMKMNMEMPGMGAGGKPMNIPAITIPIDITIQGVAANGDISYQAVLGEAGIVDEPGTPPQMAQAMKGAIAKIKGITSTGVMSNRGLSKKVEVNAAASSDPQLRQSVEQMKEGMSNLGAPVPEEAVGAGAKWEVKQPVKSQGMSIDQDATYQLTSVQGDHLSIAFTMTQNAANQKISNPAMGGMQVNLIQMTGNATGNITTDLSRLVATLATLDLHMDMNSEINMGNKKQPMDLKMGINMTMEAR